MLHIYEYSKVDEEETVYSKNIYLFGFIPLFKKDCRAIESIKPKRIGFKSEESKEEDKKENK